MRRRTAKKDGSHGRAASPAALTASASDTAPPPAPQGLCFDVKTLLEHFALTPDCWRC